MKIERRNETANAKEESSNSDENNQIQITMNN